MIGKIGFTQSTNYVRESGTNTLTKTPATQPTNVELSADMQTLNAAKQAMQQTPDVDMDKVAAMKAMLKSGDVTVNLNSLANSMIDYYSPAK